MKRILLMIMLSVAISMITQMNTTAKGDTWIDPQYIKYCEEIGAMYGVQPEFLESFIEAESSGVPTAVNGNCKGLMQVAENVHRDRMKKLGVTNLYDPRSNILVGTDLIVELFERYGDDCALVVSMYNGQSDARKRVENFDFSAYTKKVLDRAYELERIHGK